VPASLLCTALLIAFVPAQSAFAKPPAPTNVLPISIDSVTVDGNQLLAHGSIGDQPFTAPITLSTSPNAADPTCPILNLHLGPIHLDLLGLVVDTSEICLAVTAERGPGNLLGNLLCGISDLLDGGTPLGTVLGALGGADLNTVLEGITGLLNGTFEAATSSAAVAGVSDSEAGECDILNLSLGPVDLNLLGLEVVLDDCDGGPVLVDITALSGPGKLLGNLLCGLSHLLDGNASDVAINRKIAHIAREIADLLDG
jgi:hypothetical protein